MRIIIADLGGHPRERAGQVEREVCRLTASLTEKGHQVLVLYRDGVEGAYLFPLDRRAAGKWTVPELTVSPARRVLREVVRLFCPQKARAMAAQWRKEAWGKEIRRAAAFFPPELVVSASSLSTEYVRAGLGKDVPVVALALAEEEVAPAGGRPAKFPHIKPRLPGRALACPA